MLQKIKNRIKYLLSPFLKLKWGEEKGLLVSGTAILIGLSALLLIAGGVGAYVYFNWGDIMEYLLVTVLQILLSISSWALNMSGKIFEMVASSDLLKSSITKDQMVVHGWRIVRDFSNMFIVLGFVVVGIATILRYRDYEAQKTLPLLILVALLINFSTVFCGLIIDSCNITMDYFISKSGPSGIVEPYLAAASYQPFLDQMKAAKDKNPDAFIQSAVTLVAFNGVSAIVFFLFAILFLLRHVALMCLVILSPLGFLCYIFPATKPIFKKWWDQFLQWSIIGIPAAFFIYLGGHLIFQTMLTGTPTGLTGSLGWLVPTAFLLFGYTLCFQSGAIGAGAAIGLATGAAGMAWGATKWAGGKAVGATKWAGSKGVEGLRGTKTGAAIEGRIQRLGETLRITSPGAAQAAKRKGVGEAKKRMGLLSQDERDKVITRPALSRRGQTDRVAALELTAEKGKLTNAHMAHIKTAQEFGLDTEVIKKARPDWAPEIESKKFNELKGRGLSDLQARAQIIREDVEKITPSDFRKNVQTDAYTPAVLAAMSSQQIEGTMGKGGTEKQRHALRNFVSTPRGRAQIHGYGNQFAHGSLERENLARNIRQIRASGRTQPQTRTGTGGGTPPPGGGPTTPTPRPTPQRRPPRTTPGRPTP